MKRIIRRIAWCLLLLFSGIPAGAQTQSPADDLVDLENVRTLRDLFAEDASLTDELRAQILQHYDAAISSLEAAEAHKARVTTYQRERSGVDRMNEALRAALLRPEMEPALDLPKNPTMEQAEDALARERATLAANRTALRKLERLVDERATERNDIAKRLGTLDQSIVQLSDDLRAGAFSDAHPELTNASRVRVLAQREAAYAEIAALRARLELLEELSSLIPLQTDIAQTRVVFSEQMVEIHEEAAEHLRLEDAASLLSEVRELCRLAAERDPLLAPVAAETENLADMLWGASGVVVRSEEAAKSLIATRKNLSDLERIIDLTRRKFQSYGHRGAITRWWPEIPEDFPEPGDVAGSFQRLDDQIPQVEHQLITFEQLRSGALEHRQRLRLDLIAAHGEDLDPELSRTARDLVGVRRDILDDLVQQYSRYSDQLAEHRTVSRYFLEQRRLVEKFLYENVLWSRSVPRPIVPRASDMGAALGWLNPAPHLRDHAESDSGGDSRLDGRYLIIVLFVGLVVATRRRLRSRLSELAERIGDPESDSYGLTGRALTLTLLLAAPLPVLLYVISDYLARFQGSTYFFSASEALSLVAMTAFLLEFARQLFVPHGLAEAHFGWPSEWTRTFHRGLLWPEILGLPMLYIGLQLAMAGIRLDSHQDLQTFNNSLGRVAFIIALLVLGIGVLAQLRPERRIDAPAIDGQPLWSRRLSDYAFPNALLFAYPAVLLATIVPALLSAFGYYVTGLLLAYQMLRTLLLAFSVLVFGGLIHRWHSVNRSRSEHESDEDEDSAATSQLVEEAQRQVRQLTRFAIIVAMAVGLYSIWSDAFPMLKIMKRVQIWPKITIMEAVDTPVISTVAPVDAVDGTTSEGISGGGSAAPPSVPGVAASTAAAPSGSTVGSQSSTPLTLWSVLEAILAALMTYVLARNLPGVIEIFLRRRTKVDAGARVAFSTLVRYSITIIGVSVVFGLLGVSWSKIQWLAAALTFGLGFGLQEIVANFVSGIILLVERPVRVGDVVTIGTLMGKVTRIQIRATTITLWDRSEMIVPNKEFITTKLVNWTLSDSKRRIEIPVRIAYGADLEQVARILVDIANQHPAVLEEPEPHALLLGFGDDAINYELRFVVDFGQGLTTKHEVQMSIDQAFREHGIEFALPKRELKIVSDSVNVEQD